MSRKKLISIIVPVFNEKDVINEFYNRTKKILDLLISYSYELIFIDDGSTDDSYDKLIALSKLDTNIKIIKFSRNFGHQIAITAGIDYAKGDAVVIIDSDLQDPPEVIEKFLEKWEQGFDVVYGVRDRREGEGKLKLLTAHIFYRFLKTLTNVDIPSDVGDFRLLSKRAVEHFRNLREKDRFVRGLVSWIGFNQIGVNYVRDKRYAGETKYPFKKMIKFALDGVTSFSNFPLKMATFLGYITSLFALLYALSVFVQKAIGITVQGWATIMIGMLFLGGIQLICLGIIGEYIGRIFSETKNRPMYIVEHFHTTESSVNEETFSHDNFTELPLSQRAKIST